MSAINVTHKTPFELLCWLDEHQNDNVIQFEGCSAYPPIKALIQAAKDGWVQWRSGKHAVTFRVTATVRDLTLR
jgi:hypothetical protein